ncbi:MAG: NADP-dependent isocitrate dehydrogenase [Bacteroidia bacterium]|nr:NADP-dependent isocitrate dehydrogenase [Bacteroidia bacterium]
MEEKSPVIIWTKIDEAPALASYSLLPIVNAFTKAAGVEVETRDISLAGRIIANFPDNLKEDQKIHDYLTELGNLTLTKEANIIKLPNISASVPQLIAAIQELNSKGYNIPNYPEEPKTEEEHKLVERFAKVLGSAVNPVLREGNSDRRSAASVKKFSQKNPHRMMKAWSADSKSHVSFMKANDFFGNEKSFVAQNNNSFKIEFANENGVTSVLKDGLKFTTNEVIDCTFMSAKALKEFYAQQIQDAKEKGILLSLHLKATMMKVSDPVMFGYAVEVFYKEVLDKHADALKEIGFNQNNGIADLYARLDKLPVEKQKEIEADIQALYTKQPALAMVDSDKGITNLHVPNNIIIDASMPVVIRDGGKMWNTANKLQDTKCVVPDRCYSTLYQVVIEDCIKNGQYNPATMGSVSNVGLMAQKAEEYGSHPTTFIIKENGTVKVIAEDGVVLMEQKVEKGDIWRMSRVKDIPINDWVKLAVTRARQSNTPAIFWLDKNRAHDAQIIKKVELYLKDHDLTNLEIKIMCPDDAIRYTLERTRAGKDTISVTGNVLRDYLTDLFPILELGTSARMLSIVPLLGGGGLFETGAGGSAPKHVQQFLEESHLRWDSLGEFLALTVSLEHLGYNFNNKVALDLAKALDNAVGKYLENQKEPSKKAGELDNRGSHFYLAMYWAQALAEQNENADLKAKFTVAAKQLAENETIILKEIAETVGKPADIGGYYLPDDKKANNALRPSKTLNKIIDSI